MRNQYFPKSGVVAGIYKKVIDAFNYVVMYNQDMLSYKGSAAIPSFDNRPKRFRRRNKPQTGLCVSASQALLDDRVFNDLIHSRGALTKTISIDIKEQYYGPVVELVVVHRINGIPLFCTRFGIVLCYRYYLWTIW